ncbi:MAG: signal peptide peptidase SppA [Pacificimonas sp.]
MALIKGFWHFLVGVKDFLVLLLMLLIFAAILAARSASDEAPTVADGGALTIPLEGFLVTEKQEIDPLEFFSGPAPSGEIPVAELIAAIERAKDDDRVKSLVLDMDGFFGGGLANVQAVADAVADFRTVGDDDEAKTVHVYASAYFDDSWLIAAHADEIWLNPLGAVVIGGPGGSQLYFADALEKLKVDVNVFKVGTYKSFVEPYILNEASEPAKQARQALLDDLWEVFLQDAETARPGSDLPAYIAGLGDNVRGAGGDFAQAALAAGLIDRVGTRVEFGDAISEAVGRGDNDEPGLYASTDYAVYNRDGRGILPKSGDAVAIVNVAGSIVDGEAPAGTAGGGSIAMLIEDAAAEDDVKAIVLRVDSGGGSVTASEEIRQALLTAKAEGIPVIASFGSVAASGGYWVATAADEIFAQPSTITGSIGVFAILPTFERTLADLGVNADGSGVTPYSGAPDILGGLNPETEELFQLSVEDIYRRFTGIVAEARGMTVAQVDDVGQGRVWSGGAARQLGLVDRFGTLDDAIAAAEKAAGFETGELRRMTMARPKPIGVQILEDLFSSEDAVVPRSMLDLAAARSRMQAAVGIADAAQVVSGPALQVRCLACTGLVSAPARLSPDLKQWLRNVTN